VCRRTQTDTLTIASSLSVDFSLLFCFLKEKGSRKTERANIRRRRRKKEFFGEVDLHHGTALWREGGIYNAIVMLLY
jgi:hypothetical protein